jgi:hypothetical protein
MVKFSVFIFLVSLILLALSLKTSSNSSFLLTKTLAEVDFPLPVLPIRRMFLTLSSVARLTTDFLVLVSKLVCSLCEEFKLSFQL